MNMEEEPFLKEIEEARLTPNGWVYRIAGKFSENEPVPPEAIVGVWNVDPEGVIIGSFHKNPKYDSTQWPS